MKHLIELNDLDFYYAKYFKYFFPLSVCVCVLVIVKNYSRKTKFFEFLIDILQTLTLEKLFAKIKLIEREQAKAK